MTDQNKRLQAIRKRWETVNDDEYDHVILLKEINRLEKELDEAKKKAGVVNEGVEPV